MPNLDTKSAIEFAQQLRAARLAALDDAEAFGPIIQSVERLGSYLSRERLRAEKRRFGTLSKYKNDLEQLALRSGICVERADGLRSLLTPFDLLYDSVERARNDAVHQGAYARHLTQHAIELAIILEDALSTYNVTILDFAVRNPICAEGWQFIAFVRQQMLANSYSYLPVSSDAGGWRIVSDAAVARFLGPDRGSDDRKKRLTLTIKEAEAEPDTRLELMDARFIDNGAPLSDALDLLKEAPVLLVRSKEGGLVGIVTAFDLL